MALWSALKEPLIETGGFHQQDDGMGVGSRVWYKKGTHAYLATILSPAKGEPELSPQRFNIEFWKRPKHKADAEKRPVRFGHVTLCAPSADGMTVVETVLFAETDRHYLNIYEAVGGGGGIVSQQPQGVGGISVGGDGGAPSAAAAAPRNPTAPSARRSLRRGSSLAGQSRKCIGANESDLPRGLRGVLKHRIEMLHPITHIDRLPSGVPRNGEAGRTASKSARAGLLLLRVHDVHVASAHPSGVEEKDEDPSLNSATPVRFWLKTDTPEDAKEWERTLNALRTYRKPMQCVASIAQLVPAKEDASSGTGSGRMCCHFPFMPLLFCSFVASLLFALALLGYNAHLAVEEYKGSEVGKQTTPPSIAWISTVSAMSNVVWLFMLMKCVRPPATASASPGPLVRCFWVAAAQCCAVFLAAHSFLQRRSSQSAAHLPCCSLAPLASSSPACLPGTPPTI